MIINMHKLQKIILLSLVSTSALAWVVSKDQPDMMKAMMTYDPITISLFTASWTVGMVAMMFPAISPMVLLYNRLIKSNNDTGSGSSIGKDEVSSSLVVEEKNNNDHNTPHSSTFSYLLRMMLFVGCYLAVWALTGIVLLLAWSVPLNTFVVMGIERKQLDIIYGVLLIIAGAYQFSPLKTTCIGYCESPLSFFMRRWRSGTIGAVKMGTYHGLYCLGCCWPYFLLMVSLGWMNLLWMGLFACVIFGEKIWSRGVWVARIAGIGLMTLGLIAIILAPNAHSLLGVGDNNNKNSNGNTTMNMKATMDMKKETGNSRHDNTSMNNNTQAMPSMG
jgi:predicted metal-binding membrane protein